MFDIFGIFDINSTIFDRTLHIILIIIMAKRQPVPADKAIKPSIWIALHNKIFWLRKTIKGTDSNS